MTRDNKGSTLITVIVAIGFVTILTSIILSTTLTNMWMKGIDRKVKDDFYYAEKGLNDVYTGIGQETAKIAGEEYEDIFDEIGTTYLTSEDAGKAFRRAFLEKCYDKYAGTGIDADTRKGMLDAYIADSALPIRINSVIVNSVGSVKIRKNDGSLVTTIGSTEDPYDFSAVVLDNVAVCAIDKNGYQSTVFSDIVIECPTVDFLGTNAEITDYAIIGCQGVYFKESPEGKKIEVNGNLYGGVHASAIDPEDTGISSIYPRTPLYGGINIYGSDVTLKSNYVVSKGDINIGGNSPKLSIGNSDTTLGIPSIWFDSMRTMGATSSPEVEINSNVFALNDLELNANNSTVKLKGDYYGYNDKTIKPVSAELSEDKYYSLSYSSDREDADSSSIIINGNKCKLDMTDVHTLVLMGKAFIDFSSKGTVPSGYPKIAASAEGLALQPNQQLYVVPTDFLTGPNPSTVSNLVDLPSGGKGFVLNKTRDELDFDYNDPMGAVDGWFGYKYVKQTDTTDSNKSQIVPCDEIADTYAVSIDGETVYYAYLKFNDKLWKWNSTTNKYDDAEVLYGAGITPGFRGSITSKAAYFDEIMKAQNTDDFGQQPSAWRMHEKVRQSITNSDHFNSQGVFIKDPNVDHPELSEVVVYGRNAIVSYTDPSTPFTSKVKPNTHGLERFANYPQNLYKRYQLLCVCLDGKDDKKLNDSIAFSSEQKNKIELDWTKTDVDSPMDSFVFVGADPVSLPDTADKMYVANHDTNTGNKMYIDGDAANKSFGECIVSDSYTLDGELKGVAFIDGNVTIKAGSVVDGLIMATGTITVEGGSGTGTRIKANKGLIQSRIEKEISRVESGEPYKENYLISYLTRDGSNRMYSITPGTKREVNKIKPDYNSFMHYENWRKGN